MQPRLETLAAKMFVGKHMQMSFSENHTYALWRSFMPSRQKISDVLSTDLYSIEIYPPSYFEKLDYHAAFVKWAAVEVTDFGAVPDGMETLVVPAGLYAVFTHRGPASTGAATYRYIFEQWLPNSGFMLDERPHFAVMGEKYKHEDPGSEEELWIPVRHR